MKKITGILTVFAVTALVISGCGRGRPGQRNETAAPEQEIEQFNVKETKDGLTNWVLDAKSAQILESQKKVLLSSPKIKFYQKGKYVSELISEKGRINTENYDIWGDGQCLLTTVKGETLKTRNLHYRSDIQKIVTDEKVLLIRPDETIEGVGLEATPDLESIKIKKQKVILSK
jgi:LPS export ABC transporter protein LptC